MELTTKQVHEAIDKMLPFFITESSKRELHIIGIRQISLINSNAFNQVERVFSVMRDNGLIEPWTLESYRITEFGKEVVENGGWLEHLGELEDENMLDRQIKELTLEHLKKNIFQVKYWWLFLIVAAIAGGFFGELFDWLFAKP